MAPMHTSCMPPHMHADFPHLHTRALQATSPATAAADLVQLAREMLQKDEESQAQVGQTSGSSSGGWQESNLPGQSIHHHNNTYYRIHSGLPAEITHHRSYHRSPQVTTGHHRSSQVTTGHHRSPQVTTGHHRSPQVTTGHHRSPQVTTGHRSQVTTRLPPRASTRHPDHSMPWQKNHGSASSPAEPVTCLYCRLCCRGAQLRRYEAAISRVEAAKLAAADLERDYLVRIQAAAEEDLLTSSQQVRRAWRMVCQSGEHDMAL